MATKEQVLEYDYRYDFITYDDEVVNGNYFYYGINHINDCVPVVKDIKQNVVETISIKKPLSDFEIDVNIFTKGKGTLINYPTINLYIYKEDDRGFNQIIQGTPQGIFVVTIEPDNIMKISLLCSADMIYEMEFYYHGDPYNFDIELKTFLYNGSHLLLPLLEDNRLIELVDSFGKKYTRSIKFENGDEFIDTVPVIVVEDSVLKFCFDVEDNTCLGCRYYTEYQYVGNNLTNKITRSINDLQYNYFVKICNEEVQ